MTTIKDNRNETPNRSVDFSKTRKVVIAGLTIKAISAVAVVAIGVVGILIQQHLHNSQTQAEEQAAPWPSGGQQVNVAKLHPRP